MKHTVMRHAAQASAYGMAATQWGVALVTVPPALAFAVGLRAAMWPIRPGRRSLG